MYRSNYEPDDPEPPLQPKCSCGAFLPWQHTRKHQPVEGVTQYIWVCHKCGSDNVLVEDVAVTAQPPYPNDEPPF
jgi:hypothetical protein